MRRFFFGCFLLFFATDCFGQSDVKARELLEKAWQAHVSPTPLRSASFVLGGETTRYESKTDTEGFFRSVGVTDPDTLAKYTALDKIPDSRDSSLLASMRSRRSRYSFDFEKKRWASFHTSPGVSYTDSLKTVLSNGTYNGGKRPLTAQETFDMAKHFPPLLISLLRQTDSVQYRGVYRLDERPYACLGLPVGREAWALYFDPKTFLLQRIAVTATDEDPLPFGSKTIFRTTYFNDYQRRGGLLLPQSYTEVHSFDPFTTSRTTYFYSEVAVNQALNDYYFRPPYRYVPPLVTTEKLLHPNLKLITVQKHGTSRWLVAADTRQAVWLGEVSPVYDSVARRYLAPLQSLLERTFINLSTFPSPSTLNLFLETSFRIARLPKSSYELETDSWKYVANGANLKKKADALTFQLDSVQTWRLDGLTVQVLRYGKDRETALVYVPEIQTAFVNQWLSTTSKKSPLENELKVLLRRHSLQPKEFRLMNASQGTPETVAFEAWMASFGEKR